MSFVKEDIVEQASMAWFEFLGYDLNYGPETAPGAENQLRTDYTDVFLGEKLRNALSNINSQFPSSAIEEACLKLGVTNYPDLIENNQHFHKMLIEGIYVEYTKPDGSKSNGRIKLIDFENIQLNNFCAINQFTVIENRKNRRPDIVVFVNGIPLAIIELKNVNESTSIHHAYNQLQTYKKEIPTLFYSNALLVISDGLHARFGSITASYERFLPWRTIDGKDLEPKGKSELKTLLHGMFDKSVFIDLLKNFIVYEKEKGQISKIIAAYHQYHAVNKALECSIVASSNDGDKRAGVMWHTQGSGKSLSMAFFAGKVLKEMNNPKIVVVTDRNDLDDQLYKTFCSCEETLQHTPVQANSRKHLIDLLRLDSGGIIFSTIQKFSNDVNKSYPLLSDSRNIVVIVDEAHRSHYEFIDGFARNIRTGLPNASFIGFTGTPIEHSSKDTYAVFGDLIHSYDIQQAVEDGATVRIYYESRLAKIELDESEKPKLEDDFQEITEGEEIEQKDKLKNKWARLEAVVGTDKRIKIIAEDLVSHFENRLKAMVGKGMVVCMSRRICVKLYNAIVKIRPNWHSDEDEKGFIKIVMTGNASDSEVLQPHIRNKAGREIIVRRAKDPNDSLKLVIVRDMWLTGFDAPSMHTMYIDKQMKGHNLMQAIARVNRVYKDKPGGLIVDYIGIADFLKKALNYYTEKDRGYTGIPQSKAISLMMEKYEIVKQLFHNFDYLSALSGSSEAKISIIPAAMEHILLLENGRDRYLQQSLALSQSFALCAASDEAIKIREEVAFFMSIRSAFTKTTTSMGKDQEFIDSALQQLISKAVVSTDMVDIFASAGLKNPDISIISDEFLAEVKGMEHKNLATELLKKLLQDQIKTRFNKNIIQSKNFSEMLENTIQKYQKRLIDTTDVIDELIDLAIEMRKEHERGKDIGLSEDEIAFYDALADNKSAQEVLGDSQLKTISREITESIKKSTVVDWTIKESVRAKIRVTVKRILRKYRYPPDLQEKATITVLKQAELLSEDWSNQLLSIQGHNKVETHSIS